MKVRITKTPFSFGGEMNTNGGNFTNGLLEISNGGQHEENPLEGVPMGSDAEGTPNVVEEGETIYDDYVFSNRLKVPDVLKKKYKLGRSKKMTFADASKKLAEESKERPNDPLSSLALKAAMNDLRDSQEEVKAQREEAKRQTANATLQSLGLPTLDEMAQQQQIAEQQAYQQGLQDQQMAAQQGAQEQQVSPEQQTAMEQQMAQQQMAQQQAAEQQAAEQEAAEAQQQQMAPEQAAMIGAQGMFAYGGRVNRFEGGGWVINNKTGKLEWSTTATQGNPGEGYTWQEDQDAARSAYEAQKRQEELDAIPFKSTWARKVPLYANGAMAFSDAVGLTNKPTYEEANMIEQASDASWRQVHAPTIGERLVYRPIDRNWQLSQARANNAMQQRALTQNAGLNRGMNAAALLANRQAYIGGLGELARGAEEYNWNRNSDVATFNRESSKMTGDFSQAAQAANQGAYAAAKSRRLSGMQAAATQRYKERSDTDTAKGQNLTNLISSFGSYGKENMDYNRMLATLRSGAWGSVRSQDVNPFMGYAPSSTTSSTVDTEHMAEGGRIKKKKTKKWV